MRDHQPIASSDTQQRCRLAGASGDYEGGDREPLLVTLSSPTASPKFRATSLDQKNVTGKSGTIYQVHGIRKTY